MNYQQYGIDPVLIERLKKKAKKQPHRDKMKRIAEGVTKEDLQNKASVRRLIARVANTLGVTIPGEQAELMTEFIVSQGIDPNNTLHLIKLYAMFRS